MNDITDDLLDELEGLEHSTQFLNEKVKEVKSNKAELERAPSAEKISTTAMLLEACKASQQAAQMSQEAAEINIRNTQKQQTHIDDIQEVALASRQSMRSATQDIKSSKNYITALSITSILLVGGLAGASSWFLHSNQLSQQSLEQQILDIIKTENTLNQRQFNLKINELASIIELSIQDIKRPIDNFDVHFEDNQNEEHNQLDTIKLSNTAETLNALIEKNQATLLSQLQHIQQLLNNADTQAAPTSPQPNLNSLNPRFNSLDTQLRTQISEIKKIHEILSKQPRVQASPSLETSNQSSNSDWLDLKNQVNALTSQQKSMETVLEKLSESIKIMQDEITKPSSHYQYRNPYQYSN